MIDPRARRGEPAEAWRGNESGAWVVAHLWTSGPDTSHDRIVRVLAMRPGADGAWIALDRFVAAQLDGDGARERFAAEHGDCSAGIAAASPIDVVWPELAAFAGEDPILTLHGAAFRAWHEHQEARAGSAAAVIGLDELAALLAPGRLASLGDGLLAAILLPRDGPPRAIFPPEIAAAARELVARFQALDARAGGVARRGWERALDGLAEIDAPAARRLALALRLVDEPSAWAGAAGPLAGAGALADGALAALEEGEALEDACGALEPRCAALGRAWTEIDPLATGADPSSPLDARDLALLDACFEEHLPRFFAPAARADASASYRASQHAVATEIARTIGADELLLVHAPTGTGKTLAYLLPALLWARRNGVRVGVATYTRALQEQAMERDVPHALRALACAGEPDGFRVSLLKGRENYLCWRALVLALPPPDDPPESWLAWTALFAYAMSDGEGDLDRFPRRSPLGLASEAAYRRALEALVREARAETGCCTHPADRVTCAAELARRRAERSHVVITNHAFALTRTEFFEHVVFDECEHLHEQASSAWSHELSLRAARGVLASLHRPRAERSRAALDRLARSLHEASPSHASTSAALAACEQCFVGLERLGEAALDFERWRTSEERARHERERHALLREYAESELGAPLLAAREAASADLNELDAALSAVAERLDAMPVRGRGRIRRALDRARGDLAELCAALESWLPSDEGRPSLRSETFYDVSTDAAGEVVLHARVLLPNEYLGRNYYPALASGVFVSATTWLRESFDGALGYLGLDRAAAPAETEQRPGRAVRTCRAPEVFDYSRVLVAVPRDAPAVSLEKHVFLDYVRRFLAWLGERTRGRILALFTNQQDVLDVGRDLAGFFRARRIPLWYQGMDGAGKEELSELFRAHVDSILLGVDTFWYGADFPGETLEYLVLVRLPYGVPDRYHHAQCAAIGQGEQRRRIYLPRALAKFRQGFGRLMRRTSDRGAVFVLDQRILDPRHRAFLQELPLASVLEDARACRRARLVRASTERCLREALAHMDLVERVRARGLSLAFESDEAPPAIELPLEDLPF